MNSQNMQAFVKELLEITVIVKSYLRLSINIIARRTTTEVASLICKSFDLKSYQLYLLEKHSQAYNRMQMILWNVLMQNLEV